MGCNKQRATNRMQECLRVWKEEREWKKYAVLRADEDHCRLLLLEHLFKEGADLNHLERDRGFGLIPHVFWCQNLIQFFVDRGADVNSRDEKGDTALHLAIRNAELYTGTYYGSRRNIDTCTKNNPVDVIRFLLEHSADPNITNLRGNSAIFTLARKRRLGLRLYKEEKNCTKLKMAKLLMERDSDLTICNIDGESVLHTCSGESFIDVFEGDVDIRNSSWLYAKTPLMVAAGEGRLQFCQKLIERGADVNIRDLQGYSALHHAVISGNFDCAHLLIEKGADTNAKSESGRLCYDLNSYRDDFQGGRMFTYGVEATKEVEIYEMLGALTMSTYFDLKGGIMLWDDAMDLYKMFDLQPSQDFVDNYELLRRDDDNQNNPVLTDEVRRLVALNTVARLSLEKSKIWNVLHSYLGSVNYRRRGESVYNILNFLSQELKRVDDFASLEEIDFLSLLKVVQCFDDLLMNFRSESQNSLLEHILQLHSIANLAIACFNKFIHKTECNKVPSICTTLYVTLCRVLVSIQFRLADVIPDKSALNDSERLLRTLIRLDLRNRDGNTLTHLILIGFRFDYELTAHLFRFVSDFKTWNVMGIEPAQTISLKRLPNQGLFDVICQMADRGAHIDAKNVNYPYNGDVTIREVFENKFERKDLSFRYDSLQCACARVLSKSLVPYANRVPKRIVEFINLHDNYDRIPPEPTS